MRDVDYTYGEHLGMYIVESLCCKPETNTILYIKHISIKKDNNPKSQQCFLCRLFKHLQTKAKEAEQLEQFSRKK